MTCLSARCWPARKRYSPASAGGTAKVRAIASSATGARFAMTSGWNLSMRLEALEVVERLEAGVTAIQRLAGRRAELALARGPRRSAARAGRRRVALDQSARAR